MIEKGYRVVFSGQAQNNKDFVISECFVNDQGDFCQTNHKYFKE